MWIITIVLAWFLADVLTGIIHWWQDHYLTKDSRWMFLAGIARDNDLHHEKPEAMGQLSVWENINTSAPYGWLLAGALFLGGYSSLLILTIFFASFGNLVHRFSHVPRNKVPKSIQVLQRYGIFISPKHHNVHHRDNKGVIPKEISDTRFCPMTDWMNLILDKVRFFKILEEILKLVGVNPIKK